MSGKKGHTKPKNIQINLIKCDTHTQKERKTKIVLFVIPVNTEIKLYYNLSEWYQVKKN